jgi:NAD(P)-dependent dehydrogenase (short-subunit alcohol dehydrogenase family)
MGLETRVAIITGAGQGIGRAIATRLARDGAAVAIADINGDLATRAAAEMHSSGARAIGLRMDVADATSVNAAVASAAAELGPPTILVNNAGLFASGKAVSQSLERWNLTIAVNLSGSFLVSRAVIPHMLAAGWGRIINVSSMMAETAFGEDAAYCSTKAAVLGLTRSLAAEFGPFNICVNAICPGNVATPMLDDVAKGVEKRDGLEPGSFSKQRAQAIPLRRLGRPEDVADVTAFLCSSDANYVTGQALHVNGGLYFH